MTTEPMGDLLEYRSPSKREETTAWIGMVIFLGSWAMMFAALFFTYGGLRARALGWPPPGSPALPLLAPALNTATIGLSSLTFHVGLKGIKDGDARRLANMLLATTLLGIFFVGLQVMVWTELWNVGLTTRSGAYGSVFYGLTVIHAAHVLVGLFALARLTYRAFIGAYTPATYLAPRLWAMYWHFVGVVWLAMFVAVYVI